MTKDTLGCEKLQQRRSPRSGIKAISQETQKDSVPLAYLGHNFDLNLIFGKLLACDCLLSIPDSKCFALLSHRVQRDIVATSQLHTLREGKARPVVTLLGLYPNMQTKKDPNLSGKS